jgi:flavorubredoxin
VFISHDDIDHTGNLNELMARCPNATAIVNWFMVERMGEALAVPPTRQRWIGDGEAFDAGDRTLYAVRPPIYDAPTTRGLYDPTTGVYWASDSFAAPMPVPVRTVAEIDREVWREGSAMFDHYVSPWLALADDAKFQATVDRIEALRATTIAGCHTPTIQGSYVADAIANTRQVLSASVPPQPDQAVLEQIQQAMMAMAA